MIQPVTEDTQSALFGDATPYVPPVTRPAAPVAAPKAVQLGLFADDSRELAGQSAALDLFGELATDVEPSTPPAPVKPTVPAGRWTYGDVRIYSWPQCRYCGRAQSHDCKPAECPLCGSVQCYSRADCLVCHHGRMPGFWRPSESVCGRAGCDKPAVSNAPRVGCVCSEHAAVTKLRFGGRTLTIPEYVAERVAHRDSGKGWEQFRYVSH